MFKFFRNIRMQLAAENKAARYMRYAIGEIVLVVVGILIALQINNWNADQQDRRIERNYLRNLKADLETDLANLDSLTTDRQRKVQSALKLLKLPTPTSQHELAAMDSLYWNVFGWTSYIPSTATQQELISSGTLNLIENDSIKALMLHLKQQNEKLEVYMAHMRREYDNYLYDRSINNKTLLPTIDLAGTINTGVSVKDTSITKEQMAGFISEFDFMQHDLVIQNGLKLAAGNNNYIKETYASMKKNTDHLIRLIDEELND